MPIFCVRCKKSVLSGPKIVINGNYWCGDCLYKQEREKRAAKQ